jgi:hypothetical protein
MPAAEMVSCSRQISPRLKRTRSPGAKLARFTRATVFQAVDSEVPELLSFPAMLST